MIDIIKLNLHRLNKIINENLITPIVYDDGTTLTVETFNNLKKCYVTNKDYDFYIIYSYDCINSEIQGIIHDIDIDYIIKNKKLQYFYS